MVDKLRLQFSLGSLTAERPIPLSSFSFVFAEKRRTILRRVGGQFFDIVSVPRVG